jgi:hypothetical protein
MLLLLYQYINNGKKVASSLFVMLAAIFNALMDRVENENFDNSIFKNLNQKFWYKRESWKYAKKIFSYKIDCWHLSKSAMIIFLCLAIIFYSPVFRILDFVLFGTIWNLTFSLFYNVLFKNHPST